VQNAVYQEKNSNREGERGLSEVADLTQWGWGRPHYKDDTESGVVLLSLNYHLSHYFKNVCARQTPPLAGRSSLARKIPSSQHGASTVGLLSRLREPMHTQRAPVWGANAAYMPIWNCTNISSLGPPRGVSFHVVSPPIPRVR